MQVLSRAWSLVQGIPREQPDNQHKGKDVKDEDGFTKVSRKKRTTKRSQGPEVNKKLISTNTFDVLQCEQMQDTPENEGPSQSINNMEADKGEKNNPQNQDEKWI